MDGRLLLSLFSVAGTLLLAAFAARSVARQGPGWHQGVALAGTIILTIVGCLVLFMRGMVMDEYPRWPAAQLNNVYGAGVFSILSYRFLVLPRLGRSWALAGGSTLYCLWFTLGVTTVSVSTLLVMLPMQEFHIQTPAPLITLHFATKLLTFFGMTAALNALLPAPPERRRTEMARIWRHLFLRWFFISVVAVVSLLATEAAYRGNMDRKTVWFMASLLQLPLNLAGLTLVEWVDRRIANAPNAAPLGGRET
jgi:hypothetical protein